MPPSEIQVCCDGSMDFAHSPGPIFPSVFSCALLCTFQSFQTLSHASFCLGEDDAAGGGCGRVPQISNAQAELLAAVRYGGQFVPGHGSVAEYSHVSETQCV